MPWTMEDYPQSWKNFEELERKKAIDIGNAMLKDGYKESDVIPIATKEDESANPKLNEENVHVYYEDQLWKVKSKEAKRASDTFDTKSEAVNRAQHIAENKGTKVIEHRKDE